MSVFFWGNQNKKTNKQRPGTVGFNSLKEMGLIKDRQFAKKMLKQSNRIQDKCLSHLVPLT